MEIKKLRFCLILNVILLSIIGLIFIYSSSYFLAHSNFKFGCFFFFKQTAGFLIAFFLSFLFSSIDFNLIKKKSFYLFIFAIILCICTNFKFIGCSINGAKRWIYLFGINFQPVELLKPFYILFISLIIDFYKNKNNKLTFFIFFTLFLTSIILLLQPDFGQTILICLTTLLLFFMTKPKIKPILIFSGIIFLILLILLISKPYRIKRLLIFIDPWADPHGKGFQIIQSLFAISSGGLFGVGIGNSNQKLLYLPMQHTDFIFSIICEEIGLIGGSIIILLFFILSILILKIAEKVKSTFSKFFLYGSSFILLCQSAINILVTLAMLPTKGIGLPFISYGVSSIIGFGILIGLILSISFDLENKRFVPK